MFLRAYLFLPFFFFIGFFLFDFCFRAQHHRIFGLNFMWLTKKKMNYSGVTLRCSSASRHMAHLLL